MNHLIVYLSFNGNCQEAMTFYQHCLGGELTFQKVGDASVSYDLPSGMKDFILEAVLSNENIVIAGTDLIDDPLCQGNAVSILLECNTRKEIEYYYGKLSHAGKQIHPIHEGFLGGYSGMLTDRYGFHWLLRCRSSN